MIRFATPIERLDPRLLFSAIVRNYNYGVYSRAEGSTGYSTIIGTQSNGNLIVDNDQQGPGTGFLVAYTPSGRYVKGFKRTLIGVPPVDVPAIDNDDRIVIASSNENRAYRRVSITLTRDNPDGTPDTSYHGATIKTDALINAVRIDSRNRAVMLVNGTFDGQTRLVLYRFNADGTRDGTFGDGGSVLTPPTGDTLDSAGITIDAADRVLLSVGAAPPVVYAYAADGTPDASFGRHGVLSLRSAKANGPAGVTVDPQGRLLVSYVAAKGNNQAVLARYAADGTLDPTFADAGQRVFDGSAFPGTLGGAEVTFDRAGRIVGTTELTIFRLKPDGAIDRSFNDTGVIDFSATDDTVGDLTLTNAGIAVIGEDGSGGVELYTAPPPAQFAGNTLEITGTAGNDTVTVRQRGTGLRVTVNGVVYRGFAETVTAITADLGGGNDTFESDVPIHANISGGDGNDTIVSAADASTVDGGAGDDTIRTADGADLIYGGDGQDDVRSAGGNDTVNGNAGRDVIYGGNGNDSLLGAGGNDVLVGGAGHDVLQGNAGDDLLVSRDTEVDTVAGGAGTDRAYKDNQDVTSGIESVLNSL